LIGRLMSVWSLSFMAAVPLGNLHAGFGLIAYSRLRAVRALD
jgi:hypothetical protein